MRALERLGEWARDDGLICVMLISGTVLAVRAVRSTARVLVRRGRRTPGAQARLHTSAQALTWTFTTVASSVCVVLVLLRCNVPVASLNPVASVLGFGLGFGCQQLVSDVVAGAFLLAERTYAVGDTITVSSPGQGEGIRGTVEEVSLRVTRLRTFTGDLVTLPNAELRQVANTSHGWTRIMIDVPVDARADLTAVAAAIDRAGEQLATSDTWHQRVLEAPKVAGVEGLDADQVVLRVIGKVLQEDHWAAARDLRTRIAQVMRELEVQG